MSTAIVAGRLFTTAGTHPTYPEREAAILAALGEMVATVGGGCPTSITPPATLQNRDFGAATGGEDWFEVMLYLDWNSSTWPALVEALDKAREEAAQPRGKRDGFTKLPGSRGLWKVHPEGCRLGAGPGSVACRWRIERDGVVFGIVNRPASHPTRVSGFVRMTGEVMLALGTAEDVWNRAVCWLHELGAVVTKATVSRVDVCVDMPGVSVAPFVDAFRDGRVIRRVQRATEDRAPRKNAEEKPDERERVHWHGRQITGLTLLGHAAVVRVYDKAIECTDLVKRAWMIRRRWGGEDQNTAARVEFQLRRDFLTAKKLRPDARGQLNRPPIDTVEDYFDKRGELIRYLVTNWLRFVAPGFDARHTERARNMAEWTQVQRQFAAWADLDSTGVDRSPLTRAEVRTSSLWKQVRGVVETVAARLHVQIDGPDDFLGFLNSGLWEHIENDADLSHRVRRKTNTLTEVVPDAEPDQQAAPF